MNRPLNREIRFFEGSTAIAAAVACALLSLGSPVAAEGVDPDSQGYPDEQQPPIGPTDAEVDLDNSFPKRGSVIRLGVPKEYFDWKEKAYDKTGLKLGINYQLLHQRATETAPFSTFESAPPGCILSASRMATRNGTAAIHTIIALISGCSSAAQLTPGDD